MEMAGGADRRAMKLGMKTWAWLRTRYSNDVATEPHATRAFTLSFEGSRCSATTDCNSLAGRYSANGRQISLSDISATRMFCGQSRDDEFTHTLLQAHSYHFTSRGELALDLRLDTGMAVFR